VAYTQLTSIARMGTDEGNEGATNAGMHLAVVKANDHNSDLRGERQNVNVDLRIEPHKIRA